MCLISVYRVNNDILIWVRTSFISNLFQNLDRILIFMPYFHRLLWVSAYFEFFWKSWLYVFSSKLPKICKNIKLIKSWLYVFACVPRRPMNCQGCSSSSSSCARDRVEKHHEGGLWEQKCTNNFCSLTPQMEGRITWCLSSEAIGGRWRSFNMWK